MSTKSRFQYYAAAPIAVIIALLLNLLISHLTGHQLPTFIIFYPAVLIVAIMGGFWPGIIATILSLVVADYFIIFPVGSLFVFNAADLTTVVIFISMGLLVSIVAERYRRLRNKLEDMVEKRTSDLNITNQQLLKEIDARQLSQQSLRKLNAELEDRVAQQVFQIRKANENLEKRVVERTVELKAANITLQKSQQAAFNLMEDAIEAAKKEQQAKEMIRLSQQDLSRAQVVGNIGSWRMDVRKNILTWSDENHRIFGIPKGTSMTYQTFLSRIHPDDIQYVDTKWKDALTGRPYDIEHRIIVDDKIKWVREKADLEFDENNQLVGGFGITQDITVRKQMENDLLRQNEQILQSQAQLAKFNRILRALNSSNQAMIHAVDEQKFLDEVCKIIIKDCGYAMTWIGFAKDDKDKSVEPVAYSGFRNDYIQTLKITWADTPRGQGPTGTAIRTGKIAMCKNMLTDPKFEPWRNEAIKHGYASSIVLPLMEGSKAFGTLSIYSKEHDPVFCEDEINLLTELVNDLAHGITVIRSRAAHKLAEETLRKSEEKFSTLYSSMTEGVAIHEVVYDKAGKAIDYMIMDVNPAYESITGFSRDKVIGKLAKDVYSLDQSPFIDIYSQVASSGKPQSFETYFEPMNKHFAISVFSQGTGKFATVFQDITERKQMLDQLQKAKDQLEQRVIERTAELARTISALRDEARQRIAAEEKVKAERKQFFDVLETLPVMVCLLTKDHHVVFANRTFREKFGADAGLHCFEYRFGNTEPCEFCQTFEVFKTGKPHHWEFTTSDGKSVIDAHDFPFTDIDGSPMILEMDIDITEQRRAEQRIKAERKRFEDVLEMLPAYAVLLTPDYHVAYANKTFRQWFGDDNGKKCYEFLFNRTEPCDNCQTYNVLRTGKEQFWEWTGPNGNNYDIYDYPFTDSDGTPLIMEIGVDVTAHKLAQTALRQGEERYRSLVVATTQIVWTTDAQGQVAGDMPSWREFTGQSLEDIQGWGWINSLHPDDRDRTANIWSKAVQDKSLYQIEYRMRRRDGQYRYVSVRGIPIIESDGHISEWVGTCTDITEKQAVEADLEKYRQNLEEMVKQRTEELARSNKDLEQFAYVASHDLQEPLRAISGFVSLLRIQLRDLLDDKKMEYMNFTTDGVTRMQALINGLLEYSRLSSDSKKIELVDSKEALENALANLSRRIRESGTKINTGDLPELYVNRMQLTQLFQNLISNAIKFCDKQFPQIDITAAKQDSAWLFAVADNGIGIESQYADRIFQIFQRLHGREKYSGTGIGLSICKKIVESHGGKIWVESKPEKGSTFYFTIPEKGVTNESIG